MLSSHITTNNENIIDILRVLQICDSNFPIGSFNHSYGMETYLRNNEISNGKEFRKWLNVFLNNVFIYSDGLALKILYSYLDNDYDSKMYELDRLLTVQSISKETRDGSKLVAMRMIRMFLDLYECKKLEEYEKKIRNKEAFGHPAIVFGIMMYSLKFNLYETINFHMYSTVSTLVQNGVRAIPLGQRDGALILKETCEIFDYLYKKIEYMDEECFGGSSPGIELSQINHETLEFRLFMS